MEKISTSIKLDEGFDLIEATLLRNVSGGFEFTSEENLCPFCSVPKCLRENN